MEEGRGQLARFPGEQTNPWASNNFCRARGTIDAAAIIGSIDMECGGQYGWLFKGRVGQDPSGTPAIETTSTSYGFSTSNTAIVWRRTAGS